MAVANAKTVAIGAMAHRGTSSASARRDMLDEIARGKMRVIDLSYAISDRLVRWPGDEKVFAAEVHASVEKDGYFTRSFWMLEHYGTHLDAPVHFPPGKTTIDQIPVKQLFGPAVVLDVSAEGAKDADYQLPAARVEEWEKRHGRIPEDAVVLLRTGWAARWPDQAGYRNMDAQGVMHFPGYSIDAANVLIARGVVGLGIDTLSIDYGPSKDFEVHRVDLPANLYNLENLASLDALPQSGAFVIAAPIKLEGGSGGACRVFALLPTS